MDAARVSTLDHQEAEENVTPSSERLPRAVDVIRRMKEVAGLRADMHLAAALGTTRANIAKWKARNSVPYQEAVIIALQHGGSLDYIILGHEAIPFPNVVKDFLLEARAVQDVLNKYAERGVIRAEPGSSLSLSKEIQIMANLLTDQHSTMLRLASGIEKKDKVDRRQALREALSVMGIDATS